MPWKAGTPGAAAWHRQHDARKEAREPIDEPLDETGWAQSADELDISAARGVAVREFPLAGHEFVGGCTTREAIGEHVKALAVAFATRIIDGREIGVRHESIGHFGQSAA
jgi:hypothetical protein